MTRMVYTQTDWDREKTSTSVQLADIDSANFDTQIGLIVALESAINGVCIGAKYRREVVLESPGLTAVPAESAARREEKWLVTYHDNGAVQRKLNIELGCADVLTDSLRVGNTEEADLTDPLWVAFVAAFEAAVLAPWSGNNVTVEKITLVSRDT